MTSSLSSVSCIGPVGRMVDVDRLNAHVIAVVDMMRRGTAAVIVAAYVASLPPEHGGTALSHHIEDKAAPGTYAEAVFDLLCEGDFGAIPCGL